MNEADYHDKAIRYLSGKMSKEDQQEFEKFMEGDPLRMDEINTLKKIWSKSAVYDEPAPPTDLDAQWQQFSHKAFNSGGRVRAMHAWYRSWQAVAAIAILLLGAIFLLRPTAGSDTLMEIASSQKVQEVQLPDGSRAWVNANSELKYDQRFAERIVHLTGEAYFEVTHLDSDAPFTVVTTQTTTTVLGTSFNVRAYAAESDVEVEVFEGSVAFVSRAEKEQRQLLTKGLKASFQVGKGVMSEISSTNINTLAWKTGDLSFDDEALGKILYDLERIFGVKFEVEHKAVLLCTFNSDFPEAKLEEVLDELAFVLDLEINKISEAQWQISGKGCALEQ